MTVEGLQCRCREAVERGSQEIRKGVPQVSVIWEPLRLPLERDGQTGVSEEGISELCQLLALS
jgi:hypothetical protein